MPITNAAPSSPAKRGTPRTSSANTPQNASLSPRDEARKENLMGVMSAASMLALMRGQFADAGAISQHGPKVAKELVLLGKQQEGVGKVLDLLAQAGPYTGIIFATLPLLAQLAVNHNRIDAAKVSGIPGVEPKAVLEKRVRTELEQEELRLLQEAKTAEDEVAKSRAALADSMRDEAASHVHDAA